MRLQVPYIAQVTDWSCAIASIQMVLEYLGHQSFNQAALYRKLKRPAPGLKGEWCVYNSELMAEVRAMGFNVQSVLVNYTNVQDMVGTLQQHLSQGDALIATQRKSMLTLTGHSRVIVGYEDATDDGRGPYVLLHDPSTKGVPQGGPFKPWRPTDLAAMWKPKGMVVQGGEAILIRRP